MPSPTRRRPPARRGPTGVLWIGLLAVAILGGGLVLAVLKKREAEAQAAPADSGKPRPFADLPPETPPAVSAPRRAADEPFAAPASLLSDPVWQRAVGLAQEGEALYREAVEAKTKGDVPTLNALGNQAKRKLDEALETTAQLEEDLLAERGDADPLVRDVQRTRNRWFERVRWLHKSTSR